MNSVQEDVQRRIVCTGEPAHTGKLERGELSVTDCTIKNAVELLNNLYHKGMVLYLASGTDREDLEREATLLGYRPLFGDRAYGAVGDVSFEAKRIVLERILADIGHASQETILTLATDLSRSGRRIRREDMQSALPATRYAATD